MGRQLRAPRPSAGRLASIGWNRAREERGAGLRTFPLVAMASCGFVQTGLSVLGPTATTQANVMQGIITGVGFIGAGAIMRQGDATTGNATAASIWTVGIIGAAGTDISISA